MPSINIGNIEQILGMLGIEPGIAGWEAEMLPLCHAVPQYPALVCPQPFFFATFFAYSALISATDGAAMIFPTTLCRGVGVF